MGNKKMSDVFALPVSSHKGDLFNSKNPISDTRICKFFSMQQFDMAETTAMAINQHDKLTEEKKMLREVLANLHNTVVEYFNGSYDDIEDSATVESNFNDALILAAKILEKTK